MSCVFAGGGCRKHLCTLSFEMRSREQMSLLVLPAAESLWTTAAVFGKTRTGVRCAGLCRATVRQLTPRAAAAEDVELCGEVLKCARTLALAVGASRRGSRKQRSCKACSRFRSTRGCPETWSQSGGHGSACLPESLFRGADMAARERGVARRRSWKQPWQRK